MPSVSESPLRSTEKIYTAPGKVFLLGEYAVMAGLPSVVATVGPRFGLEFLGFGASCPEGTAFHPESPVAKLQRWSAAQGIAPWSVRFHDPLRGAGGFGASTAQFALAYFALLQECEAASEWPRRWQGAWKLYRELTAGQSLPPSGADLIAQWQGGVVFTDPADQHCMDVWPIFDWGTLLVFSATGAPGRKVATHAHLNDLGGELGGPRLLGEGSSLKASLEGALAEGFSAIREGDVRALGRAFTVYADVLGSAGLELSAAREDRLALGQLPGVFGVKGAGALQADAMLVLLDRARADREQIVSAALERGLTLVADGLGCQMGVTCQTLPAR